MYACAGRTRERRRRSRASARPDHHRATVSPPRPRRDRRPRRQREEEPPPPRGRRETSPRARRDGGWGGGVRGARMVSSERDEATAITGARRERESRPDRSGAPDIAPRDDACSHRRVLPPSRRSTRFLDVGALSHSRCRAPSPSPASRAVTGAGVSAAAALASEFAESPAKGTLGRPGRSRERGWRWGRGLWTDLPVGLLHELPLAKRVLLRLARLEHQHRAPQVAARRLGDALRERRREREALLARDRLPASQPDPTTQFELLNRVLCLNTADGPLGERRGLRRRETNAGTGERTRRKRENKNVLGATTTTTTT